MKYENRLADNDKLQEKIRAHRPLDAYEVKQLKEYFRIGLTYSSNALEGNSLTESETKVVLENGITIGGKPLKDHFEAIGHSEAFDLLYKLADRHDITEEDVLGLHRLFYYRIESENAGKYRKRNVIVTGTDCTHPHRQRFLSPCRSSSAICRHCALCTRLNMSPCFICNS